MTLLHFFFAAWIGYLALEAFRLRRWLEAIPVRITVTGTRGKSSVVRMLAAVLREDGWTVLGKTTGAETALILPDGKERAIRRKGRPSILEQIQVVGLGARLGVDALVVEVMSLHAENHFVESQRILRPHVVLATNFRVDHIEAHGRSRDGVAGVLALDVPPGVRVLVLEDECEEAFLRAARAQGAVVRQVAGGGGGAWVEGGPRGPNAELVRAAGEALEVGEDATERGLRGTRQDLGALRWWRYPGSGDEGEWRVVNAFAANDPESTLRILDGLPLEEGRWKSGVVRNPVGLLSLRRDRGDRSLLWAEALRTGALSRFRHLYIHGFHALALERKLRGLGGPKVEVLPTRRPREVMRRIMAGGTGPRHGGRKPGGARGGGGVLFGFGNMGGLGERMVRHWRELGEPLSLADWGTRTVEDDHPLTMDEEGPGGVHGI